MHMCMGVILSFLKDLIIKDWDTPGPGYTYQMYQARRTEYLTWPNIMELILTVYIIIVPFTSFREHQTVRFQVFVYIIINIRANLSPRPLANNSISSPGMIGSLMILPNNLACHLAPASPVLQAHELRIITGPVHYSEA